jgi:hypothetical protein
MKLREFLDKNWEAVKFHFSHNDNYIPGAIFYEITEFDFDDFIPITYISKELIKDKNIYEFRKLTTRNRLNVNFKRIFGKNVHLEHMVPKKYILEQWEKCEDIDIFENFLRKETSICFLYKYENARLPPYLGRDTLEKAFEIYKKCNIDIEEFSFNKETMKNRDYDISEQMNIKTNRWDNIMIPKDIQEKINYVTNPSVKEGLEDFVKEIINITDNRIVIKPSEKNKCDIGWRLYGNRKLVDINCHEKYYHLSIKGDYSSIPEYYRKYKDGFTEFEKIKIMSDSEKKQFLDCIKKCFDNISN